MQECLIALGGNLQISREVFDCAIAELQRRGCSDVRISHVLQTRPVGTEAGGEFLNATAAVRTNDSPETLLQTLHEIELHFLRERTQHWGPRTLDLDLILYGEFEINTAQLVIPHPAMWYRRFVLEPAVDVAARMKHPTLNESVAQLYERLLHRPLRLEICSTQRTANSEFLQSIMDEVNNSDDAIIWQLTDAEACIAPNFFGRIIVKKGKKSPTTQPFNRRRREIEIVGESMSDIVSHITNLKIAMLG